MFKTCDSDFTVKKSQIDEAEDLTVGSTNLMPESCIEKSSSAYFVSGQKCKYSFQKPTLEGMKIANGTNIGFNLTWKSYEVCQVLNGTLDLYKVNVISYCDSSLKNQSFTVLNQTICSMTFEYVGAEGCK